MGRPWPARLGKPPAAAASSSSKLLFGDATLIGGTGNAAANGDNLQLTLPDGTAAMTHSNGLSGMFRALVWDLGSDVGSFDAVLKWVTRQPGIEICVGVARLASAPTTLADLETDSHFMQVKETDTGRVSTYLKEESDGLTSGTAENKLNSTQVLYQCTIDSVGFGPHQLRHDMGTDGIQGRPGSATTAVSSGTFYAFCAWAAQSAVSGSDETTEITLTGGIRS